MQQKLLSSGGALDQLAAIDADIAAALSRFGPPPDRSLPASFETLARSIIGQQISRAAASAIWTRMRDQDHNSAPIIAAKQPNDLMPFGLSRRKAEYLIGIADEIQSGRLDLAALAEMGGEDVQKRLVEIRGIGAWTASIRLRGQFRCKTQHLSRHAKLGSVRRRCPRGPVPASSGNEGVVAS